MAYVPPHLRQRLPDDAAPPVGQDDADSSTCIAQGDSRCRDEFALEEINKHFWPEFDIFNKIFHHNTLNGSASQPTSLQYVLLFKDANPAWVGEQIIYAKSNLHLLGLPESKIPTDCGKQASTLAAKAHGNIPNSIPDTPLTSGSLGESQASPLNNISNPDGSCPPISKVSGANNSNQCPAFTLPSHVVQVFEQKSKRFNRFQFAGHYRIRHIEHLQPNSPQLVQMMERKWSISEFKNSNPTSETTNHDHSNDIYRNAGKKREPEQWRRSLSIPWAVIRFEHLTAEEESEAGLLKPEIAALDPLLLEPRHRSYLSFARTGWRGSERGSRGRGRGRGEWRGVGRNRGTGSRWGYGEGRGVEDMLGDMTVQAAPDNHASADTSKAAAASGPEEEQAMDTTEGEEDGFVLV